MHTRSDMAESMVGLNRLPPRIESRKLQFLHKIITLPAGSVSRNIFIRKLILFINDQSLVSLGYIPDICQLLLKYNLQGITNNLLLPEPCIPSKRQWKTLVKNAIDNNESGLWNQRMSTDSDFTFFCILHPCTCIAPSIIYRVCNRSSVRSIMCTIVRLWTRPVSLENELCAHCNTIYQEQLVHAVCECPATSTVRSRFFEHLSNILLPDEKHSLLELDSVALTLRPLGTPLELILDIDNEVPLLKNSFSYIVSCIQVYTN